MTLHVFIHSRSKRAQTVALLDSEATENFMNIRYAQKWSYPYKDSPKKEDSSTSMEPRTEQEH